MRMELKFKDGLTTSTPMINVQANPNFFLGLQNGVNSNEEVIVDTPQGQIRRRYSDVKSIEIFLHEF